jgi:hypothetical protein
VKERKWRLNGPDGEEAYKKSYPDHWLIIKAFLPRDKNI